MLRAFCMLASLTLPVKGEYQPGEEEISYLFRRTGKNGKSYGELLQMKAWEVQFFISENLKFLKEDCNRLMPLFDKIILGGETFSGTGYAMASMTYQQHTIVQRYVGEYYRIGTQIMDEVNAVQEGKSLNDIKERIKTVKELYEKRGETCRRMLAAFFTPVSLVTDKMVDGKQVHFNPPQTDYIFSTDQIERKQEAFRKFPQYKTDALLMHYSGVMLHYKKIFPLLFKEEGGGRTDFIDVEQSAMNALQSKLHFSNYQSIYDSNAPFILGKLHEIVKEAKSIEETNLRMKAKSK